MTRYRGILVVAQAIGLVWIASVLQLFQAPDGWFYDRAIRLGGWNESGVPGVLMVETGSRRELSVDDGLEILDRLQKLGAEQVVFLSVPVGAGDHFYRQARDYGNVIVGLAVASNLDSDDMEVSTGETGAYPVVSSALPVGVLSLPLAEFGVHRRARTKLRLGGEELPTLAMVAALHRGKQPESREYKVNFNVGADWFPHVSVDRMLGNGLIPELVMGRTVVIGQSQSIIKPGLYTPLDDNENAMSLLEYQAYAIDTLLQDKPIRTIPRALNLVVLGLIGLISLIVYQWLNLDRSSWFTLLLVGMYLGLGWLLLHLFLVWIPVVEMAITQILMFWLFIRLKLLRDDQGMRRVVLERMAKLQEYMLPPDFYNLDEHWTQVITFVDQTLNLNRVIFLEKVEGDHRVHEVQALRCSLQDIDERRRDFERIPYSDAITEGGPIRLEQRLFFNNASDGASVQYLVPLLFGGEVQGFWAFDVDPGSVESSENFLGNIRNIGSQIAELLYHRHRWIDQRNSDTGVLRRFFRLEAGKATSQEVRELLQLLDHRLATLQALFDGLAIAAIHYDLFGRVVQLNSSMEEFMRQQNLPGYQLTALDLLVEISGLPQHQARRLLQQVVVDRRDFRIPVTLNSAQSTNQSVHVKPLSAPETEAAFSGPTAPFALAGILFELSDGEGLNSRLEINEQLLEWAKLRIHHEIDLIQDAESLQLQPAVACGSALQKPLEVKNVSGMAELSILTQAHVTPRNSRSADELPDGSAGILSTLKMIQDALSVEVTNPSSGVWLVDVFPLLTSVIGEMGRVAANKGLQLKPEMPRLMGLINVQSDQLKLLFKAILDALISDAAADSTLDIHGEEREGYLHFTLRNTGFGIPDEHLQAYIWKPEYMVTEEFSQLREAVQPIAEWGGRINIHSEVGVGLWAELQLKVVV